MLTPDRPLLKNLDLLPFPNRRLLRAEYHCHHSWREHSTEKVHKYSLISRLQLLLSVLQLHVTSPQLLEGALRHEHT